MSRQQGFGAVVAIVVLVILAVMAAAIVAISSSQQITSAQDLMSAKAWQAARAGNEWGLFKAMKIQPWTATATDTCDTASRSATLDLSADTGFHVKVTCDSWIYNEGETAPGTPKTVRVYRITAIACPVAACPAAGATVAGIGYIERTRTVLATNN